MQKYELLLVLRPDWEDEKLSQHYDKFKKALTDNGATIFKDDKLGKRDLATPFKKFNSGYYYRVEFEAPGKALHELERVLTISDAVVRFMNVKMESVVDKSKRQEVAA